ncbi:MAG: hypothetical protein AAB320_00325 [Elusimicrobiota bacterium]
MRKMIMAIASPGERLRPRSGRLLPPLVDLILKNTAYAQAKAIHEDPRYRALPPLKLEPLQVGWRAIQIERSDLLREARPLDRESRRLFQKGLKLKKAAASLQRKRETLNRSVGRVSPALEKRARDLRRGIGAHNAYVAAWRKAVARLDRRAGALRGGSA